MTPVEELRAAAELCRQYHVDVSRHLSLDMAELLAGWLDDAASDFEADGVDWPVSSSEEYALRFARMVLAGRAPKGQNDVV